MSFITLGEEERNVHIAEVIFRIDLHHIEEGICHNYALLLYRRTR
jgi:hypothetical protein